jgi:uroporphyrinogen decarboxylase
VTFDERGPHVTEPVAARDDVKRIKTVDAVRDLAPVNEGVRLTRAALPESVALIGFAGAPFTLMSYLIGGKGERALAAARGLLYADPALANELLERLTDAVVSQLEAQIAAGAQAIQLFDSWAGTLTAELWRRFAAPAARRAFEALARFNIPTIYFARGAAGFLPYLGEAGAHAYGLDWLCDMKTAREALGPKVVLQGNLDPALLLTQKDTLEAATDAILAATRGEHHLFNLGHGVLPETDPAMVEALVNRVHAFSPGGAKP